MKEKLSNFFIQDITPENEWINGYKLITAAEYRDNNSYMYVETSDDSWTKREAEKFVEFCERIGVKSAIWEILEIKTLI